MIEVYPHLFIGSDEDAYDWKDTIIHAAKDPWFKNLGLSSRILWDEKDKELTLNLIDARNAIYIPLSIIDFTLKFINKNINKDNILLHCNMGLSRSASIGFIYLLKYTDILGGLNLNDACKKYLEIYPNWSPGLGMAAIFAHYFNTI